MPERTASIKPIPIPNLGGVEGSLSNQDSCLEYGQVGEITFTVPGGYYRNGAGDSFVPAIPKGCVQYGQVQKCTAPSFDEVVKWTFIDCSGNLITGTITVTESC